jgi:hypothetical protein
MVSADRSAGWQSELRLDQRQALSQFFAWHFANYGDRYRLYAAARPTVVNYTSVAAQARLSPLQGHRLSALRASWVPHSQL